MSLVLIQKCIAFFVRALEAIVINDSDFFRGHSFLSELVRTPREIALTPKAETIVTFSGGVGELIYRFLEEGNWPDLMRYGDMGVGLAKAIVASSILSASLHLRPENMGRATVIGLTLHSAEISGNSVFISQPESLPLGDLPILSRLSEVADVKTWERSLNLAKNATGGACVLIQHEQAIDYIKLRLLADHILLALELSEYPVDQPLVLLIDVNVGKTLGQYLTDWGKSPRALFVIDEIPLREARFVQVGAYQKGCVPVSFFSMQ